jgi:hypothetical protein
MTNIAEDLAFRAQCNQRIEREKLPPAMGLIWALEVGNTREMDSRVKTLSPASLARFFDLKPTEEQLEQLAKTVFTCYIPHLLAAIVHRIEDKTTAQPDTSALLFTLELLKERTIDFSNSISVLLKGQLYFALRTIVPAQEAGRIYDGFARNVYNLPRDEAGNPVAAIGAVFNSFYEEVLSRAIVTPNTVEAEEDLRVMGSSSYFIFHDKPSEIGRWFTQVKYLTQILSEATGETKTQATYLLGKRINHFSHWFQGKTSTVALQPLSRVNTITTGIHAANLFFNVLKMCSALQELPDNDRHARACATQLLAHTIRVTGKHADKLGSAQWQELESKIADKVEWATALHQVQKKGRAVVMKYMHRTDLFGEHLKNPELSDKLEMDLGL